MLQDIKSIALLSERLSYILINKLKCRIDIGFKQKKINFDGIKIFNARQNLKVLYWHRTAKPCKTDLTQYPINYWP